MDPAMDNVLTMRDEEAHTALRNKILPGVGRFPPKEIPTQ